MSGENQFGDDTPSGPASETEERRIRKNVDYFLRIDHRTGASRLHVPDPKDHERPLHERFRSTPPWNQGKNLDPEDFEYERKTLAQFPHGWEPICGHCCYVLRGGIEDVDGWAELEAAEWCPNCGAGHSAGSLRYNEVNELVCPECMKEPHCGRRVADPWWNGVQVETSIAVFEGARDAHLLDTIIRSENSE